MVVVVRVPEIIPAITADFSPEGKLADIIHQVGKMSRGVLLVNFLPLWYNSPKSIRSVPMIKRKLLLLMPLVLVLVSACRSGGTPTSNVPTATPTALSPTGVATPVPTTAPGTATCRAVKSVFASLPAPDLPPVTAQDWARGPADAPVTLVEYSDFQ